jgi:hypothetical protein
MNVTVSIHVSDGDQILVNEVFQCSDLCQAVDALRDAMDSLEGEYEDREDDEL